MAHKETLIEIQNNLKDTEIGNLMEDSHILSTIEDIEKSLKDKNQKSCFEKLLNVHPYIGRLFQWFIVTPQNHEARKKLSENINFMSLYDQSQII